MARWRAIFVESEYQFHTEILFVRNLACYVIDNAFFGLLAYA